MSGEEGHPTGTATSGTQKSPRKATPLPGLPAKKIRRTATVVVVEKAKLAQAKEKNWIPELMERWRCTIPRCHLYRKGACQIFPGESQRRSMNTAILGQWSGLIPRGELEWGGANYLQGRKLRKQYNSEVSARSCPHKAQAGATGEREDHRGFQTPTRLLQECRGQMYINRILIILLRAPKPEALRPSLTTYVHKRGKREIQGALRQSSYKSRMPQLE